jgi:hypothetical protein
MIGFEVRLQRDVRAVQAMLPGDSIGIGGQVFPWHFTYMRGDVAVAVCAEPDDDAAWFPRWLYRTVN